MSEERRNHSVLLATHLRCQSNNHRKPTCPNNINTQVCYKVPTGEGFVFELNNKVPHKVSNGGATDRVHLVVDIAESPRNRVALSPGDTCDYDPNKGMACGGAAQQAQRAQAAPQQQQLLEMQGGRIDAPPAAVVRPPTAATAAAARQPAPSNQFAHHTWQQHRPAAGVTGVTAAQAPVSAPSIQRPAVADDDARFASMTNGAYISHDDILTFDASVRPAAPRAFGRILQQQAEGQQEQQQQPGAQIQQGQQQEEQQQQPAAAQAEQLPPHVAQQLARRAAELAQLEHEMIDGGVPDLAILEMAALK
jgi:hypothetical protein